MPLTPALARIEGEGRAAQLSRGGMVVLDSDRSLIIDHTLVN